MQQQMMCSPPSRRCVLSMIPVRSMVYADVRSADCAAPCISTEHSALRPEKQKKYLTWHMDVSEDDCTCVKPLHPGQLMTQAAG